MKRRIDWALLSLAVESAALQQGLDAALAAAADAGVTPQRFVLGGALLQGLRWWRDSYRGVPIVAQGRAWWCELETDPDIKAVVRGPAAAEEAA